MIKLIKEIKASENGVKVDTYKPGDYESLPPIAMQHAENVGAIAKAKAPERNKAAKVSKRK